MTQDKVFGIDDDVMNGVCNLCGVTLREVEIMQGIFDLIGAVITPGLKFKTSCTKPPVIPGLRWCVQRSRFNDKIHELDGLKEIPVDRHLLCVFVVSPVFRTVKASSRGACGPPPDTRWRTRCSRDPRDG